MPRLDTPNLCTWTRLVFNNLYIQGTWKIIDRNDFPKSSNKIYSKENRDTFDFGNRFVKK